MWAAQEPNIRSGPFYGSLRGFVSCPPLLVYMRCICEFLLWGFSTNQNEMERVRISWRSSLSLPVGWEKCLANMFFLVVSSFSINYWSFFWFFFLQKLHLMKMGCRFGFFFVYMWERVLTEFYMFHSFITALYLIDCFEFYYFCPLSHIQKSRELRQACSLLLGFRNKKVS